jgi:hypothetical protein
MEERRIVQRDNTPVGWFDAQSIDQIFEANSADLYKTVRMYRLRSGKWVREEQPSVGTIFRHVDDQTAALWLIGQGYSRDADSLLPSAVTESKF